MRFMRQPSASLIVSPEGVKGPWIRFSAIRTAPRRRCWFRAGFRGRFVRGRI